MSKHRFLSKKNLFFLGIACSVICMLPFLLLGEGSIITYHDQLDGELLSYILTARYLFTDVSVYPELLGGLPATGAVAPAPLFVLFYVVLKPFAAFLFSQWVIYLTGFSGMYLLLCRLLTGRHTDADTDADTGTDADTVTDAAPNANVRACLIAFAVSILFMLLPFYPVYGLCIPGQPLLFFCLLCLRDKSNFGDGRDWPGFHKLRQKLLPVLGIVFYGASSSLALSGFAVLLCIGVWFLFHLFSKEDSSVKRPALLSLFWGGCILVVTYLLTNLSLLSQVLFPQNAYLSHKSEMVLSSQGGVDTFLSALWQGVDYAMAYQQVLWILLLTGAFAFVRKKVPADGLKPVFLLLGSILVICLWSGFYQGDLMTALRNESSGMLREWNLGRVTWLLPSLWCILAGYLLHWFAGLGTSLRARIVFPLLTLLFLLLWSGNVFLHGPQKPNLSKLWKTLRGQEYYALDWQSFFAEDIFAQIDQAICREDGLSKKDYHVLSVGIYPAAAAYNGFQCLDGYSNNYPLTYKHTFRKLMEGEFAKSDYVRDFFDNWGNRCYITTAEQANYYTFEKKWNSVIYDLQLDPAQMRAMDCRYVFSAAYLMNAGDIGLELLQEAPFETEGSWYHLYVYRVK